MLRRVALLLVRCLLSMSHKVSMGSMVSKSSNHKPSISILWRDVVRVDSKTALCSRPPSLCFSHHEFFSGFTVIEWLLSNPITVIEWLPSDPITVIEWLPSDLCVIQLSHTCHISKSIQFNSLHFTIKLSQTNSSCQYYMSVLHSRYTGQVITSLWYPMYPVG